MAPLHAAAESLGESNAGQSVPCSGYIALIRPGRREALDSRFPSPAGTAVEIFRGRGCSHAGKGLCQGTPSQCVARHGIGDMRIGEAPVARLRGAMKVALEPIDRFLKHVR